MNKMGLLFLAALTLGGCTFEGKVESSSLGRQMECRNRLDGEVIRFLTNDVRDVRIGLGGISFKVRCSDGQTRTLTSSEEQNWDCREEAEREARCKQHSEN